MPRKRRRHMGVIGKQDRFFGRRTRDREDYEERMKRIEDSVRRALDNVRSIIRSRYEWLERLDMHVYRTMYYIYRSKADSSIRSFLYRLGVIRYGKPDMTNPLRKWRILRRLLAFFREDIYDWLYDYLIYERPLLDARRRLRIRGDARRIREIRDEIRSGTALPLVITRYHNRTIELHLHERIDELLMSPEFQSATLEALNYIFTQLLATSYRVVIPPEDLERLKHVLAILYRYYVSFTRPMPCTRSQFLIKLTPVTLHVARGYAVRLYVLRWTSGENIRSGVLTITEPIDIYFAQLRDKKYEDDIFSSLQAVGDTSSLSEYDLVYTWRDWKGVGRNVLRLYELLYRNTVIEDGFRRATGRRENTMEVGHCSVYIGFRYSTRRFRYWWYERENIICKRYRLC